MKKYIRLKNNKVYEVDEWETDICVRTNHGWVYKADIIAESDSVFGLGGYAYFEDINGNIHVIDDIAFDFNRNEWCFSVKNVAFFENEIAKLYTKQGDNYILVWDIEKGVI